MQHGGNRQSNYFKGWKSSTSLAITGDLLRIKLVLFKPVCAAGKGEREKKKISWVL